MPQPGQYDKSGFSVHSTKKIIFFSFFSTLILVFGLITASYLVQQRQEIRKKAATQKTPTVADFKTPYSTMLARYNDTKRIQLFSGGLVLAEFDEADKKVYAGHLGNFWAPPFFSSHSTNAEYNSADYIKAFNHGLVFYNVGYGGGIPESPTDINSEKADWYPSKIVMEHFYPGGGGGTQVRGVKVALPNTRGMGLKVTMTNKTSTTQSQKLLFLGWLPTFDKLVDWPSNQPGGWNWMQGRSTTAKTTTQYDSTSDLILISNAQNSSYMAIGLSTETDSWGTDVGNYSMYSYFLNQGAGSLPNTNNDTNPNDGSAFGLVADFGNLGTNQSKTVTMIIGVGSTADQAKRIVTDNRNKNIEAESDSYWNNRISQTFSNLPDLVTGDNNLDSIYKNAILTYLLNRWEIFSSSGDLGQAAGFGQSTSLFPWFTGTTQILALADPVFWKTQLKKLFPPDFNYSQCRADEVVVGIDLCDTTYAYSPYTLLQAFYDYVTITGDFAFLTNSRYDRLNSLIAADDAKEAVDGLVNFGSDSNLYEFNIRCNLGGKYTGKVISPNADRIVAHRNLAELAEKLGKPPSEINYHLNKADAIKSSIQTLWNSSASTFDSISYYDSNGNPTGPNRVTFKTILPYLLFQYSDVLTSTQVTAMEAKLPDFTGTYGLTSLPKSAITSSCTRTDWHGPGLYSGAVGAVIEGLFKQGYSSRAYNLLAKYQYLANMPYFSQAMPYNQAKYSLAPAYMEGVGLAQAIVKGMFGIYPNTNHTKISPQIPSSLLSRGAVSLNGLITQGDSWDINVESDAVHNLTFRINAVSSPATKINQFRLGYEMNGTLNLTVQNLWANQNFKITASPLDSGSAITVYASTDSSGKLTTPLSLNGDYFINGELSEPPPTPTPTPTGGCQPGTVPGDANGDCKVDGFDYVVWWQNFGNNVGGGPSQGDFNRDGTVDGFDYVIWWQNFGT